MIPPSFDYHAPENLEEASRLLLANPEAKLLAGGHSLIPMMRFRLAEPTALVDLRRIPGLSGIREDNGSLCIGAMTRESDLEKSELVRSRYPLLADTTRVIADPVVRNLATVGGNVAHADPGNDHPATMLAYRASFVSSGPSGQRTVAASDFFTGPFSTCLEAGEILTEDPDSGLRGRLGGRLPEVRAQGRRLRGRRGGRSVATRWRPNRQCGSSAHQRRADRDPGGRR